MLPECPIIDASECAHTRGVALLPVRLENQVPLKLVAEGRIVRSDDSQTAMTIDRYEFRTRRERPNVSLIT